MTISCEQGKDWPAKRLWERQTSHWVSEKLEPRTQMQRVLFLFLPSLALSEYWLHFFCFPLRTLSHVHHVKHGCWVPEFHISQHCREALFLYHIWEESCRKALVQLWPDVQLWANQPALRDRRALQVVLVVKNLPANAGGIRDTALIPGLGRSPGGGCGNPLQYSCLENPTDRSLAGYIVHSIAKSQAWLKRLGTHRVRLLSVVNYLLWTESKYGRNLALGRTTIGTKLFTTEEKGVLVFEKNVVGR